MWGEGCDFAFCAEGWPIRHRHTCSGGLPAARTDPFPAKTRTIAQVGIAGTSPAMTMKGCLPASSDKCDPAGARVEVVDFSWIRKANLGRFTIDRLMTILAGLGQEVEVTVDVDTRQSQR